MRVGLEVTEVVRVNTKFKSNLFDFWFKQQAPESEIV